MKSPAFSFYVRDWLCSATVSKLHSKAQANSKLTSSKPQADGQGQLKPLLARGLNAYIFLLCNAWLEEPQCTLPDDDEELAALARVTIEEWEAIKPTLMLAFQKDEHTGRLFNPRQMEELKRQAERKLSGSRGGSKAQANLKLSPSKGQAKPELASSSSSAPALGVQNPPLASLKDWQLNNDIERASKHLNQQLDRNKPDPELVRAYRKELAELKAEKRRRAPAAKPKRPEPQATSVKPEPPGRFAGETAEGWAKRVAELKRVVE